MEPVSSHSNQPDDVLRIMGFVLLVLGLGVLAWVFWNAYVLWTEPESIGLLRKLAPSGELFAAISDVKHGELKVSSKFLEYANLFIAILILWIGAGIGKSLVASGSRLIGYRARAIV